MEATYPEVPSLDDNDAAEGGAAHWALAQMLWGVIVKPGDVADNGTVVTEEMLEAADVMVDDVRREGAGAQWIIEQPVQIPRTHPLAWGTPDLRFWLQQPNGRLALFVYDFKFGHRYVDAYMNWQCLEYVSGALSEAKIDGGRDGFVDVVIKIAQPRNYNAGGPIREWRTVADDLRGEFNRLSNSAHEALSDNAKLQPGPECRDCKARHACPSLQRATWVDIDRSIQVSPVDMPPEAAGLELRDLTRAIERMKARAGGLEEQLLGEARRGKPTPGWRVQHGSGRTVWKAPPEQVLAMSAFYPHVKLAKPLEPLTPKQAIKAGLPAEVVAQMAHTPSGAAELVEDDGTFTRRIFGK